MASLWFNQWGTSSSELQGHGVQHRATVCNARVRYHQYCLLQVEDEQRLGLHHVFVILRLRRRQPWTRIRLSTLS